MAIPSKQIGWGTEENLLWQISKQLETLTSVTYNSGTVILPPNRGGTGQSTYADGELLIGNTTGNTLSKATLSAGTGITITNGNGSITITATGAASGAIITGGTSINASAQLQVDSTTKGVLFPRMTTVQKNAIVSPAAGLVVYDTTLNKLCVRTASAWEVITSL